MAGGPFSLCGQLHIVTINATQEVVGIMGNGQRVAFEGVSCQWEDVFAMTRIVERYAQSAGDGMGSEQFVQAAQQGMEVVLVEFEPGAHAPHLAPLPQLIGMSIGFL